MKAGCGCDGDMTMGLVSEPCVGRASCAHHSNGFDRFWETFPRARNRDRCEAIFLSAIHAGVAAEEILIAAERYKAENAGSKAMYLAYADNWLEQRRWEDYRTKPAIRSHSRIVRDAAVFWATKVKAGKYIAPNAFSAEIAACMIDSGLVQQQDLLRAGVRM